MSTTCAPCFKNKEGNCCIIYHSLVLSLLGQPCCKLLYYHATEYCFKNKELLAQRAHNSDYSSYKFYLGNYSMI